MRDQHGRSADAEIRNQTGIAGGAGKMRQPDIEVTDVMTPAQRPVHMLLFGARFVHRPVGVHEEADSRSPLRCRRKLRSRKYGMSKKLEIAPVPDQAQAQHGLAEFVLGIEVLDEVASG